MRYEDVAEAVKDVKWMTQRKGRFIYDHVLETGARDLLEIGTFHGVSAAYMAAALEAEGGDGHLTTVDHESTSSLDPRPEELIERLGLSHRVTVIRVPDSSYDWWLMQRVEEQSDEHGNVTPLYDFCFLDGGHHYIVDGLAAMLVEKLLRPGGWLVMDDLEWTHEMDGPGAGPESDSGMHPQSEEERKAPHMRSIYDLVVRQHPAFAEFRDLEGFEWGWAQKNPGGPRRYRLETTVELKRVVHRNLRAAKRRLLRR